MCTHEILGFDGQPLSTLRADVNEHVKISSLAYVSIFITKFSSHEFQNDILLVTFTNNFMNIYIFLI